MMDRMFAGDFQKNGKAVFKQHYAQVRRLMADRPQDLLEYQVKQGWAPLCEFLHKPIPTQDFPRTNDVGSFRLWKGSIRSQHVAEMTKALAPILVSLAVLCGSVLCGSVLWALGMFG